MAESEPQCCDYRHVILICIHVHITEQNMPCQSLTKEHAIENGVFVIFWN